MYYTSEGCLYIMWSRRMKGASHGVCVLRKESPASGSSLRKFVEQTHEITGGYDEDIGYRISKGGNIKRVKICI